MCNVMNKHKWKKNVAPEVQKPAKPKNTTKKKTIIESQKRFLNNKFSESNSGLSEL